MATAAVMRASHRAARVTAALAVVLTSLPGEIRDTILVNSYPNSLHAAILVNGSPNVLRAATLV